MPAMAVYQTRCSCSDPCVVFLVDNIFLAF